MRIALFVVGMMLAIGIEILRVYFIMPFPGSQEDESVQIAYFLNQYIPYFRVMGIVLMAYPVYYFLRKGTQTFKITVVVLLGFYGLILYSINFRFLADRIFLQPKNKSFAGLLSNKVPERQLVLGVAIGNETKAYPIEIIGYHHQLQDTISGQPIMVTYCTVCRSGRVYDPRLDGKVESFRLVGMDHYNAMFEDKSTLSWWRQINGEAIAGELKGKTLNEIPSQQMTLAAWINLYPDTKILQPDTFFTDAYKELEKYDEGKKEGRLERKDSISWKDKSWVVGVQIGNRARAYDWIELQQERIIEDTLDSNPLLLVAETDSASFHVFSRIVKADTLSFTVLDHGNNLQDNKTKSIWSVSGRCTEGELKGNSLLVIQSYQEYWHSWKMFRGSNTYSSKK